MQKRAISLYVHLPFCQKRCFYCDFVSYTGKLSLANLYFKALKAELLLYTKLLRKKVIQTIYFGGGTPSLVDPYLIWDFLNFLRDNFSLIPGAEVTLEANPESVNLEKLEKWRESGVNRLSLGFQSFSPSSLKTLGRIHSAEKNFQVYEEALKAGFENINLDLIFGVPGETLEDWKKTLTLATSLNPQHLSVYSLTLKRHSRLYKIMEKGVFFQGYDEFSQADKYVFSQFFLKEQGFTHYEISNFAKPHFECKHNLTYWERGDYLGLGCSAASMIGNFRFSNYSSLKKYLEKAGRGEKPIKEAHTLSFKESLEEKIFLGLRLLRGIEAKELLDKLKYNQREQFRQVMSSLQETGLVEIQGDRIFLSLNGLLLSNQVFSRLLLALEG